MTHSANAPTPKIGATHSHFSRMNQIAPATTRQSSTTLSTRLVRSAFSMFDRARAPPGRRR
jgi:hypothetical protein